MDILLQSDGQLYPPRRTERRPRPTPEPPKKEEPPKPAPPPDPKPFLQNIPWEELLLIGIGYILIKNSDHPDLPLLLALAYILFDQKFSIKDFL